MPFDIKMDNTIKPHINSSFEITLLERQSSHEQRKFRERSTTRRIKERKYIRNGKDSVYKLNDQANIVSKRECRINDTYNINKLYLSPKKVLSETSKTNVDICYDNCLKDGLNLHRTSIDRISTDSSNTAFVKTSFLSEPKDAKDLNLNITQRYINGAPDKLILKKILSNEKKSYSFSSSIMLLFFLMYLLNSIQVASACNEAICASIVSKCTLLKSCDCEMTSEDCPCCKTCFMCLDYLQTDCCSCVGLCPTSNNTATSIPQKSKIMEYPAHTVVPSLWNALTDGDDGMESWSKETYPVDFISSELTEVQKTWQLKIKKVNALSQEQENQSVVPNNSIVTLNCTVTYLNQCMAENKCEKSCQSMGAAQYRWFQNGCCECVGYNCKNYGINQSKCLECGDDEEDVLEEDELTEEELDRMIAEKESEIEALN